MVPGRPCIADSITVSHDSIADVRLLVLIFSSEEVVLPLSSESSRVVASRRAENSMMPDFFLAIADSLPMMTALLAGAVAKRTFKSQDPN